VAGVSKQLFASLFHWQDMRSKFLNAGGSIVLKNRLDGMAYQESALNHHLRSCRNPLLGPDRRD